MASSQLSELNVEEIWNKDRSFIERWLEHCLKTHHPTCPRKSPSKLPTRLLDIGTSDSSPIVLIVHPNEKTELPETVDSIAAKKTPEDSFRYCALSYCWGTTGNTVTTLENLEARQMGISWDEIPQTVRDAIFITRKLGVRYLWVDALCIIQGKGGDWASESSKMVEVYGGAFLTLAVASSPDVNHGIWRSRSLSPTEKTDAFTALRDEPLYMRGWALQERVLSRRVLIFAKDQLYWECQKIHEASDRTKILGARSIRFRNPVMPKHWHSIVTSYCSRDLTCESDKLPAMSGVAAAYHTLTGSEDSYLAGLWRKSLVFDLLWKHNNLGFENITAPGLPNYWRAPSWSWASVNGNVAFGTVNNPFSSGCARVIETHVEKKDPKIDFCEVLSGKIVLRGPLFNASVEAGNVYWKLEEVAVAWMDIRQPVPNTSCTEMSLLKGKHNFTANRANIWCLLLFLNRVTVKVFYLLKPMGGLLSGLAHS